MEIEERLREIENRLMNTTPGPWKGEHEFNVTGRNGFVIGSFGSYFNTMMNQKELIWQKKENFLNFQQSHIHQLFVLITFFLLCKGYYMFQYLTNI